MPPSPCSTVLRQFAGPAANELAILSRPQRRSPDTIRQAESAYGALARVLAAHQGSFRDVTSELLFLRDIRRDLPLVLEARERILKDIAPDAAPLPTFIQQAPVDAEARFELATSAVIPRQRGTWSVRDIRNPPSCACAGCARSGARIMQLGDQTSLYTTNLYGVGTDPVEQASNMFAVAERLLGQAGLTFHDVVRTRIYLRDIDRDYQSLNVARRDFLHRCGIDVRPASTAIQGGPFPDVHDFCMSLYAVRSRQPLQVRVMSASSLNEAWTYGADFSRGVRFNDANGISLQISGTASIDEAGQTAHPGNFEAQVDRMLHNVGSLLGGQGGTFANVVSAVAYVKDGNDGLRLRSMLQRRGFDDVPCALVEARLCRPELLCEMEAVAALPIPAATA